MDFDFTATLEYMEKQVKKHKLNYERESARGVPEEMLNNIKAKIGYYETVVKLLEISPGRVISGYCPACDHHLALRFGWGEQLGIRVIGSSGG